MLWSDPNAPFVGYYEDHYIELHVTSSVFDDLEKMTKRSDVKIQVKLNIKGWAWLGPIGDSQLYFDTEKNYPVELASISAPNAFTDQATFLEENFDDVSKEGTESNMHLFNRLTEIGTAVYSIKTAACITGFAMITIAAALWIR